LKCKNAKYRKRVRMKKKLFISVHPDDETLGCGGTILKSKTKGDEIYWLIVTTIGNEHPLIRQEKIVYEKSEEIRLVSERYGFKKIVELNFHEILLDEIRFHDIVVKVGDVLDEIKPEIIYINNRSDVHTDHRIIFSAISSCTKSFRRPFIKKILMYETLSETEFAPALSENVFNPNVFVDISEYLEEKIEIMKIYKSEIMGNNYARSISAIRALAAYRGSRIGTNYAEAFVLLFEQA
jgi:N-acetylglucosamine malate deacetylase 1